MPKIVNVNIIVFELRNRKKVFITLVPGQTETDPAIMVSPENGQKMFVTDACGNTMVSSLTKGALYLGVK